MPRNVLGPQTIPQRLPTNLVDALADELRSAQPIGQPTINEEHFSTGAIRVLVLWDRWYMVESEDRAAQIIEAYRRVEGDDFVNRIALLDGMTFPEAYDQGLLPYQVVPILRHNDPLTLDQCREAMIAVGASKLLGNQLRFTSMEQAEACVERLIDRLPESREIWQITQNVGQVVDSRLVHEG